MGSTTPTESMVATTDRPLQYLPVALFGSVMGLCGLCAAWRIAQHQFDLPGWVSTWIGAFAVIAFLALAGGYAVKLVFAPDAVRAEFAHPIAGNLFGTFFISLLLLPLVLAPIVPRIADLVWAAGAIGMVLFAWRMVDRWTTTTQHPTHATPAWIVPVVGLLDIPIAVPALTLPPVHGVLVFGLAVGLFFAIPVFTLVFARLLFEEGMPPALQPTLMILLAPSAVGTSAYVIVTGQVDLFAQSLYMVTLFLLAVLGGRLRHLLRCCPFRVGWWAVSFPLSATAVATLRVSMAEPNVFTNGVAIGVLALSTVVIAWLAVRTVLGIVKGELKTLI